MALFVNGYVGTGSIAPCKAEVTAETVITIAVATLSRDLNVKVNSIASELTGGIATQDQ